MRVCVGAARRRPRTPAAAARAAIVNAGNRCCWCGGAKVVYRGGFEKTNDDSNFDLNEWSGTRLCLRTNTIPPLELRFRIRTGTNFDVHLSAAVSAFLYTVAVSTKNRSRIVRVQPRAQLQRCRLLLATEAAVTASCPSRTQTVHPPRFPTRPRLRKPPRLPSTPSHPLPKQPNY